MDYHSGAGSVRGRDGKIKATRSLAHTLPNRLHSSTLGSQDAARAAAVKGSPARRVGSAGEMLSPRAGGGWASGRGDAGNSSGRGGKGSGLRSSASVGDGLRPSLEHTRKSDVIINWGDGMLQSHLYARSSTGASGDELRMSHDVDEALWPSASSTSTAAGAKKPKRPKRSSGSSGNKDKSPAFGGLNKNSSIPPLSAMPPVPNAKKREEGGRSPAGADDGSGDNANSKEQPDFNPTLTRFH